MIKNLALNINMNQTEKLLILINKYNKKDKKHIEEINYLFNKLSLELKENIFLLQIRKGNLDFFNFIDMDKNLLDSFEINPYHFALNMGDTKILKKLLEYGSINSINLNDNNLTLLEKACLNKDSNSIDFLIKFGSNMDKHIIFRESKLKLKIECLDIANICYYMLNLKITSKIVKLNFLKDYVDFNEEYPFEGIKIKKIIEIIEFILNDNLDEYIKIIKMDLLLIEDNCNFDIIILYLLPFLENKLNYPYNIENEHILITELFYLISLHINNNDYKKKIYEKLNDYYLKKKILKEDYLGILLKKSFKLFIKYKNI
jgi:ankyrin repeat protein